MANDRKTFTVEIKTETDQATGEIKELGSVVKTTAGEFDNINSAIAGTEDALGKIDPRKDAQKFKQLSKELRDLRKQQERVQLTTLRFSDALANTSGITGLVGQSLQGLRQTFIVLAANPLIGALTALSGILLGLRESLTRTEEGTEKLNKISKLFKGILDGLFAVLEPLAMQLADFAIQLLENEKFMDALGKAAGILYAILVPLANFVGNQLITAFRSLVDIAGGAGKVLKGVFTFDLDLIKEGLGQAKDAVITGLTETVTNAKQLGQDLFQNFAEGIEEGSSIFRQRAEDSITDYVEWLKKQREQLDKDRLETSKLFSATLLDIEKDTLGMSLEMEEDNQQRSKKLQEEATQKKIESIQSEYEAAKAASDARQEVEELALGAVSFLAGQNAKTAKALAIVQALINTFQGATKALAQGGIFGVGSAAAIVAAGLVQVNNIRKQKVPEVQRPSGGGGRISGSSVQVPAPPTIPSIVPPQIQRDTGGVDTGRQVAESIERGSNRPVRAYVVEGDISTQQQLQRRSQRSANF